MIKYKKMSVFDAPKDSILVHACNCQGNWGSGVAVGFKQRFPKAFQEHHLHCQSVKNNLIGSADIHSDNNYQVGCIFTSRGYGKYRDSEQEILKHTRASVQHLFEQLKNVSASIYSPKINAGLFAVPWEKTEAIINELLEQYPNIEWTVCII